MKKQGSKQALGTGGMGGTRAAVAESIARWTEDAELVATSIPSLRLLRRDEPIEPVPETGVGTPAAKALG